MWLPIPDMAGVVGELQEWCQFYDEQVITFDSVTLTPRSLTPRSLTSRSLTPRSLTPRPSPLAPHPSPCTRTPRPSPLAARQQLQPLIPGSCRSVARPHSGQLGSSIDFRELGHTVGSFH